MVKPGWYPDPLGDTGKTRYWDGDRWTAYLRDRPDSGFLPVAATPDAAWQEPGAEDQPDSPAWKDGGLDGRAVGPASQDKGPPSQIEGTYPPPHPREMTPPPPLAPPARPWDNRAKTGLYIGLAGFLLGLMMIVLGYICGITGLVLSIRSLNTPNRNTAIAGIVVNCMLLVLTLTLHILFTLAMMGIITIPGLDMALPWPLGE